MTIDKIRDEKLQYDINREAVKLSALPSGNIDKYEYPKGKETLPSNWSQIIEKAKFIYSPLEKVLEKQTRKQLDALESIKLSSKWIKLNQWVTLNWEYIFKKTC